MRTWSLRAVFLTLTLGFCNLACASPYKAGALYEGTTQNEVSLQQAVAQLPPGSVVVLSESHGLPAHHHNQKNFLTALAESGAGAISVGLEFFERQYQSLVDQFTAGKLPEVDFLEAIKWGSPSFDFYRDQALFPASQGGKTLALNAARSLTSRAAKVGIEGLTPEEKAQLPPGFTIGNTNYRERFAETMNGHVPESAIDRYFAAQSIWDETMAYSAAEYVGQFKDPSQRPTLVIIVGDFHAAYGGGLPDRLKARGVSNVVVISQVNLDGLASSEEAETMKPHAKWGARADWIWVAREKQP